MPNFVELSATREYFKYFFLLFKVERPTLIIDDLPTLPLPMPQQSSFSAHIPMFAFAAAADDEPWARESIKDDTYSEHNSTEKSNSSTRPKSVTIPHNKEVRNTYVDSTDIKYYLFISEVSTPYESMYMTYYICRLLLPNLIQKSSTAR